MVASLRVAVALLALTSSGFYLAEAKTCSDPDVLYWTDDSCLYVTIGSFSDFRGPDDVRTQGCEKLLETNDLAHAWKLPKLDSIAKQRALVEALEKAGHKEAIFWTGLKRLDADSVDEANDNWSDPTKWAWWVRGEPESLLRDHFKNEKVPWATGQPNNDFLSTTTNGTEILISEQCVGAKTKPEYPWVEWFDDVCYYPPETEAPNNWQKSFRILCERELSKPTSAAPALAGPNNGPTTKSANPSESELMWITLGSVFGLLLISALAIFGAWMYKRRMKRKRTESREDSSRGRHRRSTSSQSNSLSDTSTPRWFNCFKRSKPGRDECIGRTTKMPIKKGQKL